MFIPAKGNGVRVQPRVCNARNKFTAVDAYDFDHSLRDSFSMGATSVALHPTCTGCIRHVQRVVFHLPRCSKTQARRVPFHSILRIVLFVFVRRREQYECISFEWNPSGNICNNGHRKFWILVAFPVCKSNGAVILSSHLVTSSQKQQEPRFQET